MKTISNMAKTFLKNLPGFTETDLCSHIMDHGYPRPLEPPKPPTELVCSICGNPQGYRVWDPTGIWWACRSLDCIKINGQTKGKPMHKQRICETLPDGYRLATFRDYRHGRDRILKIADWYRGSKPFLILSGTNGSGKTYSAAATINEHLKEKNKSAVFVNVSDLYVDYLQEKGSSEFAQRISRLNTPDLLVLDDMGQRVPTDAFQDLLYVVINRRSNPLQKTIVTTNFRKREDFAIKFGEAITSRILEGVQIKMVGEDQRKT